MTGVAYGDTEAGVVALSLEIEAWEKRINIKASKHDMDK